MAVFINNAQIVNAHIGPTIQLDNLTAVWDAASIVSYPRVGTVWYDLVGSNNGSMINMTSDNFNIEADGSFVFDGTDEYVTVPHNSSLDAGTDSFTVTAWIKPDGDLGASAIVVNKRGFGTESTLAGWKIVLRRATSVSWQVIDTGIDDAANAKNTNGTTSYSLTNWHHIAMSYIADSEFLIYIDGVVDCGVGSIGNYGSLSNNIPLEIGGTAYVGGNLSSPLQLFSGSIAQVQFYNKKALNSSEIKQQYMTSKGRFGL